MAAPDVASQAISSNEFGYLQQVTNDANSIINEAEAWAVGRRGGIDVSSTDPQYENNAKYYSEQASNAFENFTSLDISAVASNSASVTSITSGGIITGLQFGLPAGPTGVAGPNGVYVGEVAPTDSNIQVWIDTNAASSALMIDSDQVEYSASATYSNDTIGYAVQNIIGSVDSAVAAANSAEIIAEEAKTAVAGISILETAVASINAELLTKLTIPTLSISEGILCATKNSNEEVEYSWESEIPYSTAISSKPSINGQMIIGDKPLSYYGIAPAAPSESPYLQVGPSGIQLETLSSGIQTSLSAADTAIQVIRFNNVDYSVSATDTMKLVDLGNGLTESNIINKNYLDNPWFTINQHGNRTIDVGSITEGIYLCDRWKVINDSASGNRTITIANQSITISTVSTNDKNITIGQLIDDEVWQALSGQNVCASVNYNLGSISNTTTSWTFTCPIYNSSTTTGVQKRFNDQYNWGGRISVQEINGKKYLAFEIVYYQDYEASDDISITLRKAKLEMGNFSTLDVEAPPIYSEELKKCQKYYCYYGGKSPSESQPIILGSGIAASSTQLDWIIPIENMINTPKLYSSVDLVAYKSFGATGIGNSGILTPSNLNNSIISTGIRGIPITTTSTSNMSAAYEYYVILPASTAASDSGQPDTISYFTLNAEP